MKKDEKRTMRELSILKERNKKFVIWSLSQNVKEQVEKKYIIEEYLYVIKTKHLKDIHTIDNEMLKEQHYCFKQNKRSIVRRLKPKDKEEFSKNGVRFRPVKYKIYLK